MNDFILSQILASIAFACGVISFQCERRRSILLWMCGTALINASHFFILGNISPGTLYVIMGVRLIAAAFTTDRRVMYVFIGLVLAGFLMTYERPLDFLAMFGASLATYGNFQKTVRKVRLIYMGCAATWMIHNFIAGTPVAMLMETMFLISNLVGYWRFYRLPVKA